ncbi:MAG: hypothetical protein K2X45_21925, partial [Phreatobacter sp.]|nr:hypothetical protein [Phreatobacter sp.]
DCQWPEVRPSGLQLNTVAGKTGAVQGPDRHAINVVLASVGNSLRLLLSSLRLLCAPIIAAGMMTMVNHSPKNTQR